MAVGGDQRLCRDYSLTEGTPRTLLRMVRRPRRDLEKMVQQQE